MITEDELRKAFLDTNTAEPLSESWPGLERFAREVERLAYAEVLDAVEEDMPLERAMQLAELWEGGKMIGGDAHSVALALLREVRRLGLRAAIKHTGREDDE